MNMPCITVIIVKHCFDSRGSYETYHNFSEWGVARVERYEYRNTYGAYHCFMI